MNRRIYSILLCLAALPLLFAGCGKSRQDEDKVMATINSEPILVDDLKRDLALKFKSDPLFRITPQTLDNQLNVMIDKRLLIQEAKRQDLDRTDRFMNTIKTFWEQTLIRDLMDIKDKELEGSVTVREEEIREYYDRLSYQMTIKIAKHKDRSFIEHLAGMDPGDVVWAEEIGPISFEDVSSPVIFTAFNLDEGEKRVMKYGDLQYLVYVKTKEKQKMRPYDELRERVAGMVSNHKKRKLFDAWLAELREDADISIDENVLKGLQYKYSRE
jgi:hypothetical protein